ncbi:phosphatidylglycerophosphate synthase [Desulfocurvibacter africanus PCS]|uniref:Phosphatidylglycerophosphate synthase n=1 Tax=Desulfocurvibacter africanus PCS TaxID=1262666 RepID=M5PP08_DESAF|nr:CDP-alcohol phosphatidyltransferase family protein [Desulfocurvibacter africanus]EMG35967.1 phosphatidylglycerophosphate synthase [Desulfocurvibacter africanus PCS]
MGLRTSRLGRGYYRTLAACVLPLARGLGLGPNGITVAGLAVACLVPPAFALHPLWGLAAMALSGLADSLDGLVSREMGLSTRFGALLDSSTDRVADVFYLVGFWLLFRDDPHFVPATALFFAAMTATLLISYIKARIEGLGGSCPSALMSREARTVYLLVWALAAGLAQEGRSAVLWGGLWLYLVLCLLTAGHRLLRVGRSLDNLAPVRKPPSRKPDSA